MRRRCGCHVGYTTKDYESATLCRRIKNLVKLDTRCGFAYTRGFRQERQLGNDDKRNKHLKNYNHLPVPIPEGSLVLSTSIGNPICNKSTDGIEKLPERHHHAANFRRRHLANVDRASS